MTADEPTTAAQPDTSRCWTLVTADGTDPDDDGFNRPTSTPRPAPATS
jgi:hypothetical protein